MKKIIPLTGLPRSGSTLLMNILNQNPNFTVFPDSDLSEILCSVRGLAAEQIKMSHLPHQIFKESLLNFCRFGTESWINNTCSTDFSVDKSRSWIYQHQFMFQIFPNIKMILSVRDLRFVVNSFLKAETETFCINFQNRYQNMNENFMMQRIKDILEMPFLKQVLVSLKELIEISPTYRDQFLIFRYEELITNPQSSMNRIYNFLKISEYDHDFDYIQQYEPHNDNAYLPYGNHQIKSKLESKLPDILSHLSEKYANWIVDEYKWYYEAFYPEFLS